MPVTISGSTGVQGNVVGNVTATTVNASIVTGIGTVPTGSVFYFATSTKPNGFLVCDGSTVPNGSGTVQSVTTDFSALFAILGTTYGSAGQLPDLRGEFIRGHDGGRGIDSGRTIGSTQAESVSAHSHFSVNSDVPSNWPPTTVSPTLYTTYAYSRGATQETYTLNGTSTIPTWGPTSPTGGSETRPRNVALLPCIKY